METRFRIELNIEIAESILDALSTASAAVADVNKEKSKEYWELASKFSDCIEKVKEHESEKEK